MSILFTKYGKYFQSAHKAFKCGFKTREYSDKQMLIKGYFVPNRAYTAIILGISKAKAYSKQTIHKHIVKQKSLLDCITLYNNS